MKKAVGYVPLLMMSVRGVILIVKNGTCRFLVITVLKHVQQASLEILLIQKFPYAMNVMKNVLSVVGQGQVVRLVLMVTIW